MEPQSEESFELLYNQKYDREQAHLCTIFEEELWEKIRKELDEKDARNLSNSSPYFRKLAEKERVEKLFPDIIKLVAQKGYFDSWPKEQVVSKELAAKRQLEITATCTRNKIKNPMIKVMLTLRRASKGLKQAVEEYYESRPFAMIDSAKRTAGWLTWLKLSYAGVNYDFRPDRLRGFLSHFENPESTNPIIGKSIKIRETDEETLGHYNRVRTLLQRFGSQILYCSIEVKLFQNDRLEDRIRELRRWLLCMPNLKTLKIDWINIPWVKRDPDEYENLDQDIWQMPNLARLDELFVTNTPIQLFDALLRSNMQVQGLYVDLRGTYAFDLVNLQNLKWFALHLYGREQLEWYALTHPINSLVSIEDGELFADELGVQNWDQFELFFKLANSAFGNSERLSKLSIGIPKLPDSISECENIYKRMLQRNFLLELYHVQHAILNINEYFAIDYLQCCKKKLETLKVRVAESLIYEPILGDNRQFKLCCDYEQVNAFKCRMKFKDSNIFDIFSKLEAVKFHELGKYPRRVVTKRCAVAVD